ncbi:hypothetical protein GCM10023322_72690 [Rugosimonospora acidiphila]|uniref:Transcription regulator AsnC/Lrp ligand binding domain-containing protein n=1 Tax=Rugosimonospora acidiphila TaxID=556531 RepID=A0ABP9SPG1_9ACTN
MTPGTGGKSAVHRGRRHSEDDEARLLRTVLPVRSGPATSGPATTAGNGRVLAPAIEALVCVRTADTTDPEQFAAYLRTELAVAEVWRVAADIDAVVRLSCASLADLNAVVARMRHRGGAAHTVTYLVLPSGGDSR